MSITLRIDVDYAYSSRLKSFLATFLHVKLGKGYLENSKTIAKMVNNSPKEVQTYWFFTHQTLPDQEMLTLLLNKKHEICLHAVSNVEKEEATLTRHLAKFKSNQKIRYFNQHGIKRLLTHIIWHKIGNNLTNNSNLTYFGERKCVKIDHIGYFPPSNIYHLHPDWLFRNSKINGRIRCFEQLKKILAK